MQSTLLCLRNEGDPLGKRSWDVFHMDRAWRLCIHLVLFVSFFLFFFLYYFLLFSFFLLSFLLYVFASIKYIFWDTYAAFFSLSIKWNIMLICNLKLGSFILMCRSKGVPPSTSRQWHHRDRWGGEGQSVGHGQGALRHIKVKLNRVLGRSGEKPTVSLTTALQTSP